MAATIIDSRIFGDIFSDARMRQVWSDENRTAKYLDIERALAKVQGELARGGRLQMLAPMSFGTLWLAPLIADFMQLHPGIQVALQLDDRVTDFEREGYDLCLRVSRIRDTALIARQLAVSPRVLCCSPDYAARHGTPSTAAQILEHPCIGYCNVAAGQVWSFEPLDAPGEQITLAPQGRIRRSGACAALRRGRGGRPGRS